MSATRGRICVLTGLILALAAQACWAAGPFAFVAGRRDPRIIVIDLEKALHPANNATPNAVISRVRVAPEIAGFAVGDPANILIGPEGRFALVVNHAGNTAPSAIAPFTHGHRGTISVLDVRRALDPVNDDTTNAIARVIDSGAFGPVGLALTQNRKQALVAHSESDGDEDGGREITVIDLARGAVVQTFLMALGGGGKLPQSPGRSCADLEADPSLIPHAFPDPNVGCFPDSNGLGISLLHGGFAFAANGGTDDVSVISVERLLAGDPAAEVARIPVERGPWGLAVSPGGDLVAVTNRESAEFAVSDPGEGRTISILDVARAIAGASDAELARVVTGTDDPNDDPLTENPATASRPFSLAFTPDGRKLVVTNFRANNVSIVDVTKALVGDPSAEEMRIPLVRPVDSDGVQRAARPRGVAITPNGRLAVITGGARTTLPDGGTVWIIDLKTPSVLATVTGVGNEPYLLDITHGPR